MGVVYETIDRSSDTRVALKTLRLQLPDTLLHLKNEFRALQDLYHPNLVGLGELYEDAGQWFFTMELVDGVPLTDFVDQVSDPAERELRLRGVIGQLAKGLHALHEFGKVHRDIKPSNVLVEPGGRVVILDFGLVADASELEGGDVVGSMSHMAPEQAAAGQVGPAADWYAVGVILFELLTGALPFSGSAADIAVAKQRETAPRPSRLGADVPADLDQLCSDLLAFDPEQRPHGGDVLVRLGVEDSHLLRVPDAITTRGRRPFIGREGELEILEGARLDAIGGEAVAVIVSGRSGIGKSSLVDRYLAGLEADVTVLRGRCYEREWVPYKALDSIGDSIADYLARLPRDQAAAIIESDDTSSDVAYAADLFPVLRRVADIRSRGQATRLPDAQEQRRRAFTSFRELLIRVSRTTELVLAIDDLQWADDDSLSLLSEALAAPNGPSLLLIATERDDSASDGALRSRDFASRAKCEVRELVLDDLPIAAARELAETLIANAELAGRIDPEQIAAEAGGHPLFIDTLIRARGESEEPGEAVALDGALFSRFERLGSSERDILTVLAIAAGPVPQRVAASAADVGLPAFARLAGLLRVAHFVRTGGSRLGDEIDLYHDRIRETITGHLDAGAQASWHQRLALALEATGNADPEALLIHFRGAGDNERAARYAQKAADDAAAAFAFERAARLYEAAIDLLLPSSSERRLPGADGQDDKMRELRIKAGDAFANAGRGAAAAKAYQAAIDGAPAALELELRRRAGEQLLRSGRVDSGLAELRQVLASIGSSLPSGHRVAIARLLWQRLRLGLRNYRYTEVDETEIAPAALARIDILWTASLQTAFIDPTAGSYFSACHLAEALRAGEPYRISRALAVEMAYLVGRGEPHRDKLLSVAKRCEELAERLQNPHAIGLTLGMRGLAGFGSGRWREGFEYSERGIEYMSSRCAGVEWELNNGKFFGAACLVYLGEFDELGRRLPALIRDAADRGDWYADANLRSGILNATWLAADQPSVARREAVESFGRWPQSGFHMQHVSDLNANALIDLYVGDAREAAARVEEAWPRLRRSFLLTVEFVRVICRELRGKVALAAARLGDRRRVRLASKVAGQLLGEKVAWGHSLGRLLAAGVAAVRNSPEAPELYRRAAGALDECDMVVHAAVARLRAAELEDDVEARADQHAIMRERGIRDPERFARTLG